MAALTPAFRAESQKVHDDHQTLLRDLAGLDAALDRLVCYSEVFADLASADQVHRYGLRLAEQLPDHFAREEATVLATVAEISPELAQFAQEMKREHEQLRESLAAFCRALEELDKSEDLDDAVCHLRERGKNLTRELGRHVALEEHELSGFL